MADSNTGGAAGSRAADQELVLTRVFDAPRELAFKGWNESFDRLADYLATA
jgi:hypothetical protein